MKIKKHKKKKKKRKKRRTADANEDFDNVDADKFVLPEPSPEERMKDHGEIGVPACRGRKQ